MKQFLFLLIVVAGMASCTKSITYENEFDKSHTAFRKFKASANNSYVYTTTTSSWTGYNTKTTITVKNGEVIRRVFESRNISEKVPNVPGIIESWTEEKSTLNSHESGFRAILLDAVYEMCRKEFLTVDRNKNEIVFSAENEGMLSVCGFIPYGCADDCFQGVTIESITSIN